MRREQRVGLQRLIAREGHLDEQHVAVLAGCYPQSELEACVTVDDLHRWHARRRQLNDILPQPLDLDPEARAIADEKTEIADLRDVDTRIVDLVNDAAADGEPQPRRAERAADHVLVAAAPGRGESGSSGCVAHRRLRDWRRAADTDITPECGSQILRPPLKACSLLPRRTPGGSFFNRRALPPPSTM